MKILMKKRYQSSILLRDGRAQIHTDANANGKIVCQKLTEYGYVLNKKIRAQQK